MRVAALVLAAGASRRAGAANKLLAQDASGGRMIARTVAAACRSRAERVIVVLGHERAAIAAALDAAGLTHGQRLCLSDSRDHAAGLSASLRCGISQAATEQMDAALVCLGDMPLVQPSTLNRLIERMRMDDGADACVPTMDGRRGNPVLWRDRRFGALLALDGDTGARALLDAGGRAVFEVAVRDPGVLRDFDTPAHLADYATLQETA